MKKGSIALVLILAAMLVAGMACSTSTPTSIAPDGDTVLDGDTVKVLYTGTLDDGTVFDSSELHGGKPLEFTLGTGQVIPGFEKAVLGMMLGELKTVHITSDEAYGPRTSGNTHPLAGKNLNFEITLVQIIHHPPAMPE